MATPCTNDPNEVIEKVVSAKANADKFDAFVNGTDTETVQLGTGDPTPTIRNAVRQIMADASWARGHIADAPEGDVSLNNAAALLTSQSRTLAERFADVLTVKDFGAKGDGVTDDTAAFEAAAASSFHSIYIPAGTYVLSKQIVFEKPVSITGCGMNHTKLVWTSNAVSSGLYIDSNSLYDTTIVRDLSLLTSQINIGTALTIDYSSLVNDQNVSFPRVRLMAQVINVFIEGKDLYYTNGWNAGIYLKDCMSCIVYGSKIVGYLNTNNNSIGSDGAGIRVGKNGLPAVVYIQNTQLSVWTKAIHSEDFEGLYLSTSDIVNCIYGVYVNNQNIEPYVSIANSHLNCRLTCIYLHNTGQFSISGCDFYIFDTYVAETKRTIHLDACSQGHIYGNTFERQSGASGEWIAIDCQNYTSYMSIISNGFFDKGTEPVVNKAINLKNALYYKIGGNTIYNIAENNMVVKDSTADIKFLSPDQSETYNKVYLTSNHTGTRYRLYVGLYHETNDSFPIPYFVFDPQTGIYPLKDNALPLGQPSYRYSHLYCADGTIQTSDARLKQEIKDVSESVMHAWSNVKFKQFLFNDSVKEKGVDKARIHIGVIAQNIKESFDAEGIDAFKFGLLCYDEWEDEYEEVTIVDQKPEFDEKGKTIKQAKMHTEKRKTLEAGTRFSVRYDEALALECAYQRWLGDQRDARIAELEARLNEISGNGSAPSGASPDNI